MRRDHRKALTVAQRLNPLLSGRPKWRVWCGVYLGVIAVSLLAHLPEICGWVSCNPIYRYHGLVLLPIHHLLPGACSTDGNDGTTLQAFGGRIAEMWLHGRMPWWNTYAGLGLPLAAEGQPGAFFLPFVLLLHFIEGVLLLKVTMQIVAGACLVAMLREAGMGRAGAATGGMLFAVNGTFAWSADAPILPIAFLPALLFGLERCRTRATIAKPGGPACVAVALAYSLTAGFPETAFMDGILAAAWAVGTLLRTPADRRPALLKKISFGGLAGIALSAPAWLSFLDYLQIAPVSVHGFVAGNHFAADQAAALLMPSIYGPPYADGSFSSWSEDGGYFGSGMAFLGLLSLFSGVRFASLRWILASWILFWLSVFFGMPVVHAIWAAIPPLNQVGITRYAMPSLECAGAVLAAIAIDDWCCAQRRLRPAYAVLLFATAAIAALAFGAKAGRLSFAAGNGPVFNHAAELAAISVVGMLAWLLTAPPNFARLVILTVVLASEACGNFILPEFAGTTPNRLALEPIRFLQSHAGYARVFALNERLPNNYGSWFGTAHSQVVSLPYADVWTKAAIAIGGGINVIVTGWAMTPVSQISELNRMITQVPGNRQQSETV